MNTGQRLAAVQMAGHTAIDAVYAPVARDLPVFLLRYATPVGGVLRFTLQVVPLLKSFVDRVLQTIHPALVGTIVGAAREAETVADPVGQIDERDLVLGGFAVDQSLRVNQAIVVSQAGMLLVDGVEQQLPAREIARRVGQYLSPWFAPRRDATGALLRADRVGAVASWPGRAGMASAHARMLMRYESSRAHTRGMIRRARRDDLWLDWSFGAGHNEADECDDLAEQGPYLADDAPWPPVHFGCICYLEPTDPPRNARRR